MEKPIYEWIKKKNERRDLDKIIVGAFNYYQKNKITRNEFWEFAKIKYDGTIYNFFGQLKNKRYLYNDKTDKKNDWVLRDDYKEILVFSHGNKLNTISNMAEKILQEHSGIMKLNELVEILIKKYDFAEKSIYASLKDKSKFYKNTSKGNMIITIAKKSTDKLLRISESEFEEFLLRSKSEEALFDFKQGILQLSEKRKFDENSFEKIMKNVCAMANHGIGKKGRLFIGVADKMNHAKRIEDFDKIKVPVVNEVGVCGIEREAIILGYDLEKYQNYILSKIESSAIPEKLKTHLKSNIGYINQIPIRLIMWNQMKMRLL